MLEEGAPHIHVPSMFLRGYLMLIDVDVGHCLCVEPTAEVV